MNTVEEILKYIKEQIEEEREIAKMMEKEYGIDSHLYTSSVASIDTLSRLFIAITVKE